MEDQNQIRFEKELQIRLESTKKTLLKQLEAENKILIEALR